MNQKTDDLEEKVNLLLENIELKEKLEQYEISHKFLESKVSELEAGIKKYRFKKNSHLEEKKVDSKSIIAMWTLIIGGGIYWGYSDFPFSEETRIRNMVSAFVEAANSKKVKELPDYISCKWGLQDNNSPIEEIISKVLNEGYIIEQINITGIESYKFFCQEGRPCDYGVAFETYLSQQGKDTKLKGLLSVRCDGDCKFNIVRNRIKSCPSYATIEKD